MTSQVMASNDGAQFYSFGPFFNSSGTLYGTPHIFHYAAGTTTNKNCWSDQAKTSTVAQPFVGNADGTAEMYCDGDYKFVIKNTAETVTIDTWDNVKISSDAAIYPEWLGAVGDGSTDDTTALQAAIDEASTTGAKVMLRAKTYKHTSALTFKPGVIIEGMGNSSVLRYTGASGFGIAMAETSSEKNNCGLRNLKIDSDASGIELYNGRLGRYENIEVYVRGSGAIAIQVRAGSWWNTFNNIFLNSDDITYCNGTIGLEFVNAQGQPNDPQPNANNILNCRFHGLHYGIWVENGFDNNDVNSRFEKVRYHYYLNDSRFKSVNSTHEKGDTDQLLQLDFTLGTSIINSGETIQNNGYSAVVANVEVVSGSWPGGDAAGTLSLYNQTGEFKAGFITVDSTNKATISGNSSGGYFLVKATSDAGYNFLSNVGWVIGQKVDIIDLSGKLNIEKGVGGFEKRTSLSGKSTPLYLLEQCVTPVGDVVLGIKSKSDIGTGSDFISALAGTAEKFSVRGDGLVTGSGLAGTWQTISYASSITPDLSNGSFVRVGQLTGNITVQNPTHASNGMIMLIKFSNGATQRNITWGSEFTGVTYTSIRASKNAIVMFVRIDTGVWNQVGTVQEF